MKGQRPKSSTEKWSVNLHKTPREETPGMGGDVGLWPLVFGACGMSHDELSCRHGL